MATVNVALARARNKRHRDKMTEEQKESRRKRAREIAAVSKDKSRAKRRAFYKKHGDRLRQEMRDRRKSGAFNAYQRERYWSDVAASRLKGIERESLRRARLAAVTVDKVDYAAIKVRDRMLCHICRRRVAEKSLHFDHVIPLSKGGAHVAENIAVAHDKCNLQKHASITRLF